MNTTIAARCSKVYRGATAEKAPSPGPNLRSNSALQVQLSPDAASITVELQGKVEYLLLVADLAQLDHHKWKYSEAKTVGSAPTSRLKLAFHLEQRLIGNAVSDCIKRVIVASHNLGCSVLIKIITTRSGNTTFRLVIEEDMKSPPHALD